MLEKTLAYDRICPFFIIYKYLMFYSTRYRLLCFANIYFFGKKNALAYIEINVTTYHHVNFFLKIYDLNSVTGT
jgi:hypothetical protein